MNDEKTNVSSVNVLLVDDEESVLEPMAELLEAFGYNVISADSGQKAIDAIKQNNEINIVVLDVIMPDMDGIQALYQIRQLHPKLPVILASGYNYPDHIDDIEDNEWNDFIYKPYDVQNLILKIQSVLSA